MWVDEIDHNDCSSSSADIDGTVTIVLIFVV